MTKLKAKVKIKPRFNKTEASILRGLKQAVRLAKGENVPGVRVTHVRVPRELDVKAIRARLGMSQIKFAHSFGFPPSTLQNWEQGVRYPDTTARILLSIIQHEPAIVQRVLAQYI